MHPVQVVPMAGAEEAKRLAGHGGEIGLDPSQRGLRPSEGIADDHRNHLFQREHRGRGNCRHSGGRKRT